MTNLELLKDLHLGSSVAEEESKELRNYFIETDAWGRLYRGDIDIVYGGKGTGKSALYLLLLGDSEQMRKEKHIHVIPGENVSEAPVFRALDEANDIDEKEYIAVWNFYILSLLGNYIRDNLSTIAGATPILKRLEAARLIPVSGLDQVLKVVRRYVSMIRPSATVHGVEYTISLGEPTIEEEKNGIISAQTLLKNIDSILKASGESIWILFDRLDIAFTRPDTEAPALRGLFRVYRDLSGLDNLKLKIFLRNDIWERITRDVGFREQSHITKVFTIDWIPETLRHLVLSRFVANDSFVSFSGINHDALKRAQLQDAAMKIIFPDQVESGPKQRGTFDWILSRVQDGKGNYAPREVIHLITTSREEQVRLEETGATGSGGRSLLSPNALKLALDKVSKKKIETLYAEFPKLRPYIEVFKGMKTEYNTESISSLFEEHSLRADVGLTIKELIDIGFLQEKASSSGTSFWIPFIFRPFLGMIQGSAFEKERIIK